MRNFLILSTILFSLETQGQNCENIEQIAFNFFISSIAKEQKYLVNKKYVFDKKINDSYSEFDDLRTCFEGEIDLYKKVKGSAYNAIYYKTNISLCEFITIDNAFIKRFVKKKIKNKVLKMEIFKATKTDSSWYVQIRIKNIEYQDDYFIEIGLDESVVRWCNSSKIY